MTQRNLYCVVAILLFGSLSKCQLTDSFRIVNKKDLLASGGDLFEDKSTKSFSQLLFDVARDQVIVGARDALYRLSLQGLRQLERAEWPASPEAIKSCQDKGQSEDNCHNYISVLLAHGYKLFVCGTYAFSPQCTWRKLESIGAVTERVSGVAKSPFSPHANVTALIAASGEYYAGTPTDFAGSFTAISRSRGAALHETGMLRTTQYDLNWLNEPQYVGTFEDDTFVYFVFREVAVEFMACGKSIYSRIARVCKSDPGAHHEDGVGIWTTFLKARLTCFVPGDVKFYYDEVQGIQYLPEQKVLLATFTTNSNSIAGSALCVYNMSEIHSVFEGSYKKPDGHRRPPETNERDHFNCLNNKIPKQDYRYQLMYESVEPISGEPIYKATLQRFTHITVDVAPTKSGTQLVAYVATTDSDILKLVVLPWYDGACMIEVLKLKDSDGGFDVRTMQFVKETMSVYIGSERGVVRVAGARCERLRGRAACAGGADPHCGWDEVSGECVRAGDNAPASTLIACPPNNAPVDGGWSVWSEWERCVQEGTASAAYGDRPDLCWCRRRRCDNPSPANGGLSCKGASISVSNCTVHGGWSQWSSWSECSATCGIATRTRRRACAAPEPRFGGRVCVGLDTQDQYCTNLPPCPDPALAPVDGGWSPWSAWGPCVGAAGCGAGAGWRERRRTCDSPAPAHGGDHCDGAAFDRQPCDLRPCELRKATAWTPWVQTIGNTTDGSYVEKRFKFLCKAPSSEQIRLSLSREEERYCTPSGACSSSPPEGEGGWSTWGAWGSCSAPCGGGQQARSRRCRRPPCSGPAEMLRACNTHACSGEWSCWSEWSTCTGGCEGDGVGRRSRTRMCLSPEGCADAGAALETATCLAQCQESEEVWSAWGEWSRCDNGELVRRRECGGASCAGAQVQLRPAPGRSAYADNELYAMAAYSRLSEPAAQPQARRSALGVGGIVGCVVAAFIIGCVVCGAGLAYWQRRGTLPWGRGARVPSSPHYITAKQNSYVTVPLKDVPRKAKRQPSFSGMSSSSGVLLSKSNNLTNANNHNIAATPKLYPKAIASEYESMGTLRRHSNQPNNKSNLDLEADKFY